MLEALEQSAVDLARNERDHAWRDMARRCHEIKNPLTPMRLQLRQRAPLLPHRASRVAGHHPVHGGADRPSDRDRLGLFALCLAARYEGRARQTCFMCSGEVCSCSRRRESGSNARKEPFGVTVGPVERAFNNLQNAVQAIPNDRKPEITVKALTGGKKSSDQRRQRHWNGGRTEEALVRTRFLPSPKE